MDERLKEWSEEQTRDLLTDAQDEASSRMVEELVKTLYESTETEKDIFGTPSNARDVIGVSAMDIPELYGIAFKVFFLFHIKVMDRVLEAAFDYRVAKMQMDNLRRECKMYRTKMQELKRRMLVKPKPTTISRSGRKVIEILDGYIVGCILLLKSCAQRVKEINEWMEIKKPFDSFGLVLGEATTTVSRQDLCTEILDLIDETDRVVDFRNAWAVTQRVNQIRLNIRQRLELSCQDSPF